MTETPSWLEIIAARSYLKIVAMVSFDRLKQVFLAKNVSYNIILSLTNSRKPCVLVPTGSWLLKKKINRSYSCYERVQFMNHSSNMTKLALLKVIKSLTTHHMNAKETKTFFLYFACHQLALDGFDQLLSFARCILQALRSKNNNTFSRAEIQTRGHWVWSANTTSVLCGPQRN